MISAPCDHPNNPPLSLDNHHYFDDDDDSEDDDNDNNDDMMATMTIDTWRKKITFGRNNKLLMGCNQTNFMSDCFLNTNANENTNTECKI